MTSIEMNQKLQSQKEFEKGKIQHQQGNLDEAALCYKLAIKFNANNAQALNNLGVLLMQQSGVVKYEESRLLILRAIQINPSEAQFRHTLGTVHKLIGNFVLAADAFERAVEKNPSSTKYMHDLATVLKKLKRFGRASEVYASIFECQPDQEIQSLYKKAVCCKMNGNMHAATQSFKKYLEQCPDDIHAKFWLAAIEGNTGAFKTFPKEMVTSLYNSYAEKFDDHPRFNTKLRSCLTSSYKNILRKRNMDEAQTLDAGPD